MSIFQNYREDEKNTSKPVEAPSVANTSTPKQSNQENEKNAPSALELLLNGLNEQYHFISFERHLYVYDERYGYWRLIPASNSNYELRTLIPKDLKRIALKVNFSALYDWLLVDAERVDSTFFEEKWHWINFKNYAYNWEKHKVEKDRKRFNFRYVLNINCPSKNDQPTGAFHKFVEHLFDDNDTRNEFCKFLALCFGNVRTLKYCFFLHGASNTGKSTMLNVIKYILGEENCSSLSFSQFSNEFALTQLLGKRANLSGEVSGATNKKMDILKSASGNDTIAMSYKGKDHFTYQNLCMLIFACNTLPCIPDFLEVSSFLSRMIIFPFSKPVAREDWDKDLLQKLTADVAGIFQCIVSGFRLLEKDGYKIKESEAMRIPKTSYAGTWESFSLFCDKYIVPDPKGKLTSAEIQNAYRVFCNQHDYVELASNQWSQVLRRNIPCKPSTAVKHVEGEKKTRGRAYKGITFSKSISDLLEKEPVVHNDSHGSNSNSFLPSNYNL